MPPTLTLSASILHEDDDLIVISKPPEIHSVQRREAIAADEDDSDATPTSGGESVAALLAEYDPSFRTVSSDPLESGLIQRLDFETSGVMIAAKNRTAWDALRTALQGGAIKKSYLVLAEGIAARTYKIDTKIGNRYRHSKKVTVIDDPSGSKSKKLRTMLPARTIFSPLHAATDLDATVLEAHAPTARRHQVRAHAEYIGHSLVGDSLYGSKRTLREVLGIGHCPAFFLHAERIEFSHPITKEIISIRAAAPAIWSNTPLAEYLAARNDL